MSKLLYNHVMSDYLCVYVAPLYVMIPPASSAEILQAMGQTRPIAPKTTSPILDLNLQDNIDP